MPSTHYCGRCLTTFESTPPACPNLGCGAPRPAEGWGVVLGPGDLLDRRYRVERCLAVGGAGLTYLAQEVDDAGARVGPRVAIKVLYSARASGPFLRRLSTEAQILQELAHEHIVQLRGFVHRAGHEPYLVTRFEEGGSLAAHLERTGPLPVRVAAGVLKQVLLALDTAHQRGVVHRDLKPDNVLLAAAVPRDTLPHVRVADFGIAKIAGGMMGSQLTRVGAFVGTPEFAAPEQFEGQNPTPATDVFAAGGLLFFLLTGRAPFAFSHRADIANSLAELLDQLPVHLPALPGALPDEQDALQEALDHMLVQRPEDRWTIHRILQSLAPLLGTSPRIGTLEITGRPAPSRQSLPPAEPTDETLAVPASPPGLASLTDAPPARAASVPPPAPSLDAVPMPPPLDGISVTDAPPPPRTVQPSVPPPPSDLPPPPPADVPPPPPSLHGAPADLPPPPPPSFHAAEAWDPAPPTMPIPDLPPADDPPAPALAIDLPPPPPNAVPAPPPPPEVAPPPPPEVPPAPLADVALRPPTLEPADPPSEEVRPSIPPPPPPPPPPAPAPASARPPTEPSSAEIPAPPPFVPGEPARPIAPPPAAAPAANGGGTGAVAGAAGCFGLSIVGMGVVGVGGVVVVALLLVGIAWGTGWLGGGAPVPPPVVVDDELPERLRDARPLPDPQAKSVQRAARDLAPTIRAKCALPASTTISADLYVNASGNVQFAKVDPAGLATADRACVKKGLEKVRAPGVSTEGVARVVLKP